MTATNLDGPTATGHRKLRAEDLYSLEQYARQRAQFRSRVLSHKKQRTLQVGPNATFLFEDRLTVQYQVQEMLRIERIFEAEGIADELGAYNPLIPDGSNWKATFLLEYPDPVARKAALAGLKGIEDRCWVQVAGHERVYAIADEDLDRENEEKTSSVHFLRFELTPAMVAAAKGGAAVSVGVDHDSYRHAVDPVAEPVRTALVADLA
ncbi:MAG TPA: DUF3501 family protein [Steroidobacteraceae bacterium]|nr:DUF3501 family protein [Steroidobacteraceae bacterium]